MLPPLTIVHSATAERDVEACSSEVYSYRLAHATAGSCDERGGLVPQTE